MEQVEALADTSRPGCVVIATKPVHRLQIRPTRTKFWQGGFWHSRIQMSRLEQFSVWSTWCHWQ